MNKNEKLAELRSLQVKADALRHELGISQPGKIVYQTSLDVAADEMVLVEADGFGGAMVRVVEGNYPMDYSTKFERFFQAESEAENAADEVASRKRSPREILVALD